ncbi:hypothetical protein LTR05_007942 [Lithohypha guttulata]|uniref:Zn(2)-C6 fungal-type domain-containing protein n=1 Tax=Lithohypha guttulata TaxID=1690604 RepID=A0AAN7STN6_9EURO|nr:hypothetical protein LTR05_007942 [Lithohypha guttulata]
MASNHTPDTTNSGNSSSGNVVQSDAAISTSRRRKYVSTACQSCRKAKIKCDGANPCQRCIHRAVECIRDELKDGRRVRKRDFEELHARANALDTLVESIQSSDDESIRELVRLIRGEGSIKDITQHARGILTRNKEIRSRSHPRIRHSVLSIASLIDEPPFQVPAQPWTNVTTDDNAVSHLISAYFTWQYHQYPSVVPDILVREMNAQDTSSQLCSSLLVNTILFNACMYTDHVCAFANPGDPSTRGLHYLEEATRLWNLEEGSVSLTTHQALPSMMAGLVVIARDRAGLLYTGRLSALTTELIMKVKASKRQGKTEFTSDDFQRSYRSSIWASYNIRMELALAYRRSSELQKPQVKRPFVDNELQYQTVWRPYPDLGPEAPLCQFMINDARFDLSEITAELVPLSLSGDPQDSPLPGHIILDKVEKQVRLGEVEARLLTWQRSLPPGTRIEDALGAFATSPLVDLHLAYYSRYINIQSILLHDTDIHDAKKPGVEEKLIQSCKTVADLCMTCFAPVHVQTAALAAYSLMDLLTRAEVRDSFHVMIVALSGSSRRWPLVRGILKVLWHTLQERKLDAYLAEATVTLLKLSAVDNWGLQDHRLFEGSAYPNISVANEKGLEFAEMSDLLNQYSLLNTDDDTKVPIK